MVYPRADNILSISQVIGDWSNSGPDRLPESRILSELLRAFWLSELEIYPPGGTTSASQATFLDGLLSDPGERIVFLKSSAKRPPERIKLPNGSVAVNVAHYIRWSVNSPDSDRLAVYKQLAEIRAADYPAMFLRAFRTHVIRRDDLAALCDSRNWRRPGFWFLTPTARNPTKSNHLVGCRQFLKKLFVSTIKQSKDQVWKDAERLFPSLSRSAFDREWAKLAPQSWKKGGRPGAR